MTLLYSKSERKEKNLGTGIRGYGKLIKKSSNAASQRTMMAGYQSGHALYCPLIGRVVETIEADP